MVRLAGIRTATHHRPMQTTHAMRRRLAAGIGMVAILFTLGSASVAGAATVVLKPVASGLSKPVLVTNAHDGSGRLFIVEKTGKIRVMKNGALLPTPLINLTSQVSTGSEQGLLGLAFHPSFKTNGLFYVDFTRLNGDTVIDQYRVSPTNGNVAVLSSVRHIIAIAQPYANHNGGDIVFGPDGYLYIGMGDGGSAGDPGNRAQNVNSLLGKILRINVNGSVGTQQYRIPSGNPYIGRTGRDEIWSLGLRNPWRFSFDRLTGALWIGDVGQSNYEEIDRSTVAGSARGRGVNFGWRQLEGRHCYNPATGCNTTGKMMPVVEYTHSEGCAVTGGFVYRGTAVPSLVGRYVFGDYCSGRIWTVANGAASPMTKALLLDTNMLISSFGEDEHGELYVVDLNGSIYRFAAA
jgi:glucose/arabinose dehydrogenase